MTPETELELLRAERDLYRALLDLGSHDDVAPFLDDALALVVDVTGATRGYLALDAAPSASAPRFAISRGFTEREIDAIRAEISTGIVAEALRTGRTIGTASALEDPRFRDNRSVQAGRIQAVLCAPIGGTSPLGVLYLQGRAAPGPFPERERTLVELFAQRVAPLAQRVLAQRPVTPRDDPTRELRARLKLDDLVGVSRALADTFQKLAVAAPVDVTVLLVGESGTGKTAIAKALHDNSRRARGAFVEINCAALPETLVEAELFGAEKGAHSTATRRIPGKIAAAQGGTLFLDEVGELPLAAQAKLLQFLQSKKYWRLGADAPTEADVRLIAATNADLETAIREKRFREDLYYRLNVLTLRVPTLAERADDVPVLAEFFLEAANRAFGRSLTLTWSARAALASAAWPGNVRQLSAAIQRGAAFAIGDGADAIDARHLFPESAPAEPSAQTWQEATRRFQKRFLQEALEACSGNVSEVARRIDVARSHLHELLRAHGLGRAGR